MKKDKKRVILTGGHAATTALSSIQEIKRRDLNWEIIWIGSNKAVEGKKHTTLEFKTFPSLGVKCYSLTMGRLQRKFTRYSLISLAKVPIGFVQAFFLILKLRPDCVVSFGGFVSFPVVVAARIFSIPVIVHEQTIAAGLANRLSGHFATVVTLAREESKKYYGAAKSVVIGNPILSQIEALEPKKSISKRPVVYITGGSRGAQRVNNVVRASLFKLLESYQIIHQTGEFDYEEFKELQESLPQEARKYYEVYAFVDPLSVSKMYSRADLVVGRSGANTVSEIIASRRPSLLIPIPWVQFNEQKKNALHAKEIGIAEILEEKDLNPANFLKLLKKITSNWKVMLDKSTKAQFVADKNASARLVDIVISQMYLPENI